MQFSGCDCSWSSHNNQRRARVCIDILYSKVVVVQWLFDMQNAHFIYIRQCKFIMLKRLLVIYQQLTFWPLCKKDVRSFTNNILRRHFNRVLLVGWKVTCKRYVTAWERVGPGNYFDNAGDAFRARFITLHEISFGNPDRKMLVLMKKRTVI